MEENKIKNENILSDSNQSLICHLTDIYPNNFNAIEDVHIPRYDEISKRFSKIYGISIQYFIRVPGIINLIGDPVKLYGYTPISFALDQDIVFAFAINDKNTLNITNSQSALYPKITISNEISQKFDEENAYLNLLLAGYKAALQDSFVSVPKGISLFISSNLPTKNGNFSSSALILGMYCTALIANNMINKFYHPNTIENLLKYERMLFPQTQFSYHINTMLFGKKDSAFFWRNENKKIELPKNYNFIIANSLTPTPSFYLSGQRQNKRLAECGIGICMMMKKLEMKEYTKVKNLNDLQELLGYGSEEMILLLKDSVEEKNYKTEEIEKIFGNEIITLIADIPYANNVIQSNKDYNPYGY